jgi:hypothetical protein
MSLPLTRPGALLIAARRPDPGNGHLIAAVSVGDPAAAQRAGERLERCDGLIFVITVPSTFRAMLRGSHQRRDIGYDLARCLWDRLHEMPDAATINEQLDIIADAAGLDREHARRSAIFRAVDYWLWGLQHGFTEDPRRCRRLPTARLQ